MDKAEINIQKQQLNDVMFMRPLAIVLLVVWHAFIVYAGGWREPMGFQPIESYWWLAKLSYAFMLELFVFISGYVFGLSLQKHNLSFREVVVSKLKRLIVPGILFSLIYYMMFYDLGKFTIIGFVVDILSGCGHLWFLPMLFWVTILGYVIDKIRIVGWIKALIIICLPVLSVLPLPFGIGAALYYIPFFYAGIMVFRRRDNIVSNYCNVLNNSILWGGVFCSLFVIGTWFIKNVMLPYKEMVDSIILKGFVLEISIYIRLVCASVGVLFIYLLVNYLVYTKKIEITGWLVKINAICFGIYIFQQFILQMLYYKTTLPNTVGPYWLPWIGFVIALCGSAVLSWLFRKTKVGRMLI